MAGISRAEAAQTILSRQENQHSLAAWARYKGFEPARHHRMLIGEIEPFVRGETDYEVLLLHAPPGSAKSTYTSVLTPSWYLGNYPTNKILAATHSSEFAEDWGKAVRNDVLADGRELGEKGIHIRPGSSASDKWRLLEGGEYRGAGADKGISGSRCNFGLCDDLFGKRQDALSPTIRNSRWNWYLADFGGRLVPRARRLLMSTRWHMGDVNGHVLDQMASGIVKGKEITLRARAEADDPLGRKIGQYLWDDDDYGYPEFLKQRERELTPEMWEALYQQRPIAESGDYFKAEWIKTYVPQSLPPRKEMIFYGASDFAVTSDGGDYTVHIVVGIDPDGRMYVVDLWRGQTDSDVWVERFCDLVKKWKPLGWAFEKGQITKSVGPFLRSRQYQREAFVAMEEFPTVGDKAVRAQSIRGRMAHRKLYLDETAPWYKPLVAELLTFDKGLNDDQVDALGLIGQLLDKMIVGTREFKEPQKDPRDGYKPLDDERMDSMILG